MQQRGRILLTGASGWFGQSFISEFINYFGVESLRRLIPVTSDGRSISHPMLSSRLQTITFKEASKLRNIQEVIQASFLTRDKIQFLGAEKYSQECQLIINYVSDIISKNPQSKVFLISSGAIYSDQSLYGKYKRIEEEVIQSKALSDTNIFRIFGATTKYMDFRKWSAICGFIKTANQDIKITSNYEILRGIVCMEDLSRMIINMIDDERRSFENNVIVDAVSDIVSIREIAIMCLGSKNRVLLPDKFDDTIIDTSYTGDPLLFRKLASNYKINLKTPKQQIKNAKKNLYPGSYK